MPKVSKTAYLTSENYGATSEDIKDYGYDHYRVYLYSRYDYTATDYTMYANIPSVAQNIHLHFYVEDLVISGTSSVKINGSDVDVSSKWNDIEVSHASSYNFFVGVKRGWQVQYPGPWYYTIFGKNAGAYAPYVTYDELEPSVSGIRINDTCIEHNITCEWDQADTTACTLQVIKDGNILINVDVTGINTYTILANTLTVPGNYTFKVIGTRGIYTAEDLEEKTLTGITPSITDVALSSAEVERGTNIATTVKGTNVDGYTVNILNSGNTVIASNVGSTFSTSSLESGSYKAQIVAYHTNGHYTTYDTETVSFKTTQITPKITTAALSTNNVEKGTNIVSTITGENVTGHVVDILDSNSNLIASNVGTTFSTSSLINGSYKAQIKAYYTKEGVYTSYSAPTTIDFSVFTYNAEITSIWPNTTNELRNSNIQLGFSAKNFTSYSISAIQDGVTKYTTSGSNSSNIDEIITKIFSMVKNLFSQGQATISVNVTNVRNGYSNTDTMTVTFNVIDNPNTPTLTSEQTYSTPKPIVSIACSSTYISYKTCIDDVESSEIFGSIQSYYFETALTNNEYHTFKVKVKNMYGLWSEWGSCTFYISYAELETPEFSVYVDTKNGCICVAMESEKQENFKDHSVLRLENGTWVEIGKELNRICTFYDNSCASGTKYTYKVRANDTYGGYKDGDIVEKSIDFDGTVLSIPWTNRKLKLEYYSSEDDINKNVVPSNSDTYVEVCGLSLPKLQKGTLKNRSLPLNIVFKTKDKYDEFMSFIQNDVLLLRDGKGLKMYCHIIPTNYKDYRYYYKCVSIAITEVYYKEGDFIEIPDRPFTWAREEF